MIYVNLELLMYEIQKIESPIDKDILIRLIKTFLSGL